MVGLLDVCDLVGRAPLEVLGVIVLVVLEQEFVYYQVSAAVQLFDVKNCQLVWVLGKFDATYGLDFSTII
jgi:hypothetical protein